MTKDLKKIDRVNIDYNNRCLKFTIEDTEVVLPRLGFLPRSDDRVFIYSEGEEDKEVLYYAFENKKGESEASYGVSKDGSVSYQCKGDSPVYVSKEDMIEVRKGKVGFFDGDGDNQEFIPLDRNTIVGWTALGALGHIPGAVLACGAALGTMGVLKHTKKGNVQVDVRVCDDLVKKMLENSKSL